MGPASCILYCILIERVKVGPWVDEFVQLAVRIRIHFDIGV